MNIDDLLREVEGSEPVSSSWLRLQLRTLKRHMETAQATPRVVVEPYIPSYCKGEKCFCGRDAVRKIEEHAEAGALLSHHHPLTAYVCDAHFVEAFGAGAQRQFPHTKLVRQMPDERVSKFTRLYFDATTARPAAEYHEDMGPVLWWRLEFDNPELPAHWAAEPPYVGTPNDLGHTVEIIYRVHGEPDTIHRHLVGGWREGYYTHFTPILTPEVPK